jgi:hypothetical protein
MNASHGELQLLAALSTVPADITMGAAQVYLPLREYAEGEASRRDLQRRVLCTGELFVANRTNS